MHCCLRFACSPKITKNPYVKAHNLRFCVSLGSAHQPVGRKQPSMQYFLRGSSAERMVFRAANLFFSASSLLCNFLFLKTIGRQGKNLHTDPLFLDYKIKRTKLVMTFLEKKGKNSHGLFEHCIILPNTEERFLKFSTQCLKV